MALRTGFRNVFNVFAPFLLLTIFTFSAAGIFYAVERSSCSRSQITFWKAVHFIMTVETTIGYGDVSPCSAWGQLLTIIFILIGLPLSLLCLSHLGRGLEVLFNTIYFLIKFYDKKKPKDKHVPVPLYIGILATLSWILLCSVYFYFTLESFYSLNSGEHEFTYFSAVYFTLITFFTVGLGDISPMNYELILITFLLILIGLALVTMCIDIVQTKLEIVFAKMRNLIQREYAKNLGKEHQTAAVCDLKQAEADLDRLMKENKKEVGWYSNFFSSKNRRELAELHLEKANMISKRVQTEIVHVNSCTNTFVPLQHNQAQTENAVNDKSTDVEGLNQPRGGGGRNIHRGSISSEELFFESKIEPNIDTSNYKSPSRSANHSAIPVLRQLNDRSETTSPEDADVKKIILTRLNTPKSDER